MTFADKVKIVRAKLFLSQEKLAKEIGVSQVTVARWETQGISRLYFLHFGSSYYEVHGTAKTIGKQNDIDKFW